MSALLAAAIMFAGLTSYACRNRAERVEVAGPEVAGEPQQYSATVVHTVEDGDRREISVSRVSRLGEMWREEWTEQGEMRALIWRPDMGKSFLLSLGRAFYVETNISGADQPKAGPPRSPGSSSAPAPGRSDESGVEGFAGGNAQPLDPVAVDRAFDAPAILSDETRTLPDQTIDNHPCAVSERSMSFAGGHVEVTRTYRARDLAGLAIRIETESRGSEHGLKIITERRGVELEVRPEEFTIPAEFKKVDRIPSGE